MNKNSPFIFDLTIKNERIETWIDLNSREPIPRLSRPLTGRDYKIYVIVEGEKIHYIGVTKRSLKSRLNYGLKANGTNGYHGYKWKVLENVRIFIWDFKGFDKNEVENVEAELAFLVRTKTGRWPESQNEIHFNNKFQGKELAEEMYKQIRNNFPKTIRCESQL